jgi:hypothetical protein
MHNVIKFSAINNTAFNGIRPIPASNMIPDWWKNAEPFSEENGIKIPTVKRCGPALDGIISGYYILTQVDMLYRDKRFFYESNNKQIEVWKSSQSKYYENIDGYTEDVYKFINYWITETPPGWSSLFMHPIGYNSLPFRTISGIVDTDILKSDINPPFRMKSNWSGVIQAGTPIAQIIPIKRDKWNHEISYMGKDLFKKEQEKIQNGSFGEYIKKMRRLKKYD